MSVHTPIAVCCSCKTEHVRLCHATASVVHIASREAMSLAKFGIKVHAALSVNADDGPRDCMSDEIATPTKKRRAIAQFSQTDGCAAAGSPASPPSPIKVDGQLLRSGGDSNARSAPDVSGPLHGACRRSRHTLFGRQVPWRIFRLCRLRWETVFVDC